MPNTYDYRVLRRMYEEKFETPCLLNTKEITDLWLSTRRKGEPRHSRPDLLVQRAAETLDLMRAAVPARPRRRRAPKPGRR